MWQQKQITLNDKERGFHLITREVLEQLPELNSFKRGLAHFFIQHTSASLAINENADPSVRRDLEAFFSNKVAENEVYYTHILEGSDDMPAHIKSVLIGTEISIPIARGELLLGVWQGIYLCEHRNHAGRRSLIVTLSGE
jgi:secondary thiamine-phosphate synthase enzyme